MASGLRKTLHLATLTRYPDTPYPAPNQRWEDCDKRAKMSERHLLVFMIEERTRGGKTIDVAFCAVYERGFDTGRRTSIDVKRFVPTSTGYRFVEMIKKETAENALP